MNLRRPSTSEILRLTKNPIAEITTEVEARHGKKSTDLGRSSATVHALAEAFVLNPDHTVRERRAWGAKSFVSNFIAGMYEAIACNQSGYPTPAWGSWGAQAIDGTRLSWNNSSISSVPQYVGVGGGQGIMVGTSTTSPAPADHALGSMISHGYGSGSLFYFENVIVYGISTGFPASGQAGLVIQRLVSNLTSADITVAEMGLFGYPITGTKATLFIHDVLPTSLVIPAGYPAAFQYTIYVGGDATANLLSGILALFSCQTLNGWNISYGQVGNWTSSSSSMWRDTSNNVSNRSNNIIGIATVAGAPGTSGAVNGIVFGSGNAAHAITDYALGALIANGSGSGQITYGTQIASSAPAISGSNTSMSIQRVGTNSYTSALTVNEQGLYLYGTTGMLSRKLLNGGAGYSLAAGAQLTGYLTIGVTT